MQSPNSPPDGLGREYWAWFGFWAELVVLGALAIFGGYAASRGEPGDYATGLILGIAAIALAFFRLKRRFDGAPTDWPRFLLVDDMPNLALVIAVFVALGLAGLFIAAAALSGSLHVAGIALFATSGVIVFLSLKNVFDTLDRRG
jgi:small-conductance mechanosensitive channel